MDERFRAADGFGNYPFDRQPSPVHRTRRAVDGHFLAVADTFELTAADDTGDLQLACDDGGVGSEAALLRDDGCCPPHGRQVVWRGLRAQEHERAAGDAASVDVDL